MMEVSEKMVHVVRQGGDGTRWKTVRRQYTMEGDEETVHNMEGGEETVHSIR